MYFRIINSFCQFQLVTISRRIYYTVLMAELPPEFSNEIVIRDNQRYCTYRAELEGEPVFIKQVKADGPAKGIRRELWGLEAFRQLAEANDDLGFTVPKVIAYGEDYVVTSWAEGKPVDFSPDSPTYDEALEFFAHSLATIDMRTSLVDPPTLEPSIAISSIHKLRSRLMSTPYAAHIDATLIDKAFKLLNDAPPLPIRLTHADFTPGNVLEHHGQRTLVDYESVSTVWARFYDLVNLTFNRMATKPGLTPGCRHIIERYFALNTSVDMGSVVPELNIIALHRSLSLLLEHLSEPNKRHNTVASLTPEISERLTLAIRGLLVGKPYFETLT